MLEDSGTQAMPQAVARYRLSQSDEKKTRGLHTARGKGRRARETGKKKGRKEKKRKKKETAGLRGNKKRKG